MRVLLTCVLDLMFSNMPAIPPSDWSKWCPSFRGSFTVYPKSAYRSDYLFKVSYLQDPLILLSVCVVCLLGRCNVVLEVRGGMLPCLEALSEELCDLKLMLKM